VPEVRAQGIESIVDQVIKQMAECDMIYVSFDVDSMDPSISVGTGTPVPGGFEESEAKHMLELFAMDSKVRCIEFTEINPLLDKGGNAMGSAAFRLLQNTVYRLQDRLSRPSNR
jgi:arginase